MVMDMSGILRKNIREHAIKKNHAELLYHIPK